MAAIGRTMATQTLVVEKILGASQSYSFPSMARSNTARKILIVDDELDIRVFMTTLLETSGFKPVATEDGGEGLDWARKHKPALVIMDVMMPEESGIFPDHTTGSGPGGCIGKQIKPCT